MSPKKKCRYACHCLKVTEDDVIEAIRAHELRDVEDITRFTQAGDGCTACHPLLQKLCETEAKLADATSPRPSPSAPQDSSKALPA
ncbi:MAG TPA: (2Fe-2S)-binding protein [Elusimicrobiota bacterium]|nr:(2Fe-2S)-binding protein [Elusimicrobiota bacterium]